MREGLDSADAFPESRVLRPVHHVDDGLLRALGRISDGVLQLPVPIFWSVTMTTLSKNGRVEPPDHELRRRFDRVERAQIDGKYLDSDG